MAIIDTHAAVEHAYSDGSIEAELLAYFSQPGTPPPLTYESWAHRYHLSPERHTLLSWYNFTSESSLLEIGGGLGALTGLFCSRVRSVVSVELTKARAQTIFNRHRSADNLIVLAADFANINFECRFDYVACIGVLEYASRFSASPNPHLDFLKRTRQVLNTGGKLLLAIENRYGLKYWSGAREDHTGRFFDSLEGYPRNSGARTFGRQELQQLLEEAGFTHSYFYYPLPDYKLPIEIFSDSYLPSPKTPILSGMYPFVDPSQSREVLFDERLTMDGLIDNKLFTTFANSFLVEATA